jgi:hypothetical protein
MDKAITRLHRLIMKEVNSGDTTLGAMVIVGHQTDAARGNCTCFSGGNTGPIVMGLAQEMRRSPSILTAVKMAVAYVEKDLTNAN